METPMSLEQVAQELTQLREAIHALDEKLGRMTEGYKRPVFETEHPHIIRVENVKGGEPIIRGKGITVQTIVVLAKQMSVQQLVDEYDGVLTLAEIYDALSYYYDHPDEIEQYIAENRAALERPWPPHASS